MGFIEKRKLTLEGVTAHRVALLATLTKHRREIVASLRGKRALPLHLSDEAIVEKIASAAAFVVAFGGALAPLYPTDHALTAKQRREHFEQLAATLDRSRELLDQTLEHADTDPEFLMELMDDAIKAGLSEPTPPDFAEPIKQARDAVANMATLAAAAVERVPVRRGPPTGGHVVNPDLIRSLAHVYTEATGQQPGNSNGSLVEFATAAVHALGIAVPDNYDMQEPIRDALSHGQHAAKKEARRRERRSKHR